MQSPAVDVKATDFAPRHMPLDRLVLPADGEMHLWFLDLGALARSLRGALDGHVDGDDTTPFTVGQLRFARRFYLRILLGAYLDLPGKAIHINRSKRGKPVLDASEHSQPLHFSMAKSEDRVLIGFACGCPLGVDLEPSERQARNALGLARRYFSVQESTALAALGSAERDAAFLRTWACKEAVVKASGEGIANQLCRFTVETALTHPVRILDFDGDVAADWTLALLQPEARFLGAVAMRRPGQRIRALRLLPPAAA